MIAIVGEGLRKRPPFTPVDKFLRSHLRRAGVNERKCDFLAPTDSIGDAIYVLILGREASRSLVELYEQDRGLHQLNAHSIFGSDVLVFCTYHPAYVMRRKSLLPRFRDDLETFAALVMLDSGHESRH